MNKTALITGASSGIGMDLAREFAKDKIDVILVARTGDKLKKLAEELASRHGIKAYTLSKDLSDYRSANEVFDWCNKAGIRVDYLVNNAGVGDFGMFAESSWEKNLQMINLNITSLTHLTRLFLPGMIERKFGKISNVASTAAFQPGPTMAVYYATKAYVLHFSEALGNEVAGTGVTVTALCPGATASGFQSAADLHESKLVKGKKLPTSAEVAKWGYGKIMKGQAVAIHGWYNYVQANAVRFIPRSWVVKIARSIQES